MPLLQTLLKPFSHLPSPPPLSLFHPPNPRPNPNPPFLICSLGNRSCRPIPSLLAASATPNPNNSSDPDSDPSPKPTKPRRRRLKPKNAPEVASAGDGGALPSTIPQKPRRGRRSEAAAVEDFVRGRLEETFASIRRQSAEVMEGKDAALKDRAGPADAEEEDGESTGEDGAEKEGQGKKATVVVEEEDPDWPLDADVGWGTRASEYFEKHPIKNVVVDGVEIDWEGEVDEGWVKEINCLEWESFAFHPSPLIVLVFERYTRAADNWKLLKELEKAAKVYWNAKDRLPPRTVKIDMNIETDLAYALKVRECPQLLFLRGSRILYREKEIRTADELVQMIAHFYYNAKRPSWVDAAAVAPF